MAALVLSGLSVLFSSAVYWIHRERLKLDLYNLRFGVYRRTLDICQVLEEYTPATGKQMMRGEFVEPPRMREAMNDLSKAIVEAQFLFEDKAIQERLESIKASAESTKECMCKFRVNMKSEERDLEFEKLTKCVQAIDESMLMLHQTMSDYLKYKPPFFGPR